MYEPIEPLLAAFWRSILDDLHGRGVTTDDGLPYQVRRLPYRQRVTIEREHLRAQADAFLASPDFVWWAETCGLNPGLLKETLTQDGDNLESE